MKKQAGKYFLKLILVGVIPILVVGVTVAVTLSPSENPTFYDFGVPFLIIGIVIALLSLFLLSSVSSWRRRLEDYLPEEARGQGVRDGSKDFLWTTMITGIILALSGFGLINTSLNQGIRAPNPETRPFVSSLRGELKIHEEYAKEYWVEDAYLNNATVWVGDDPRWIIQSQYESLLKPKESILIYTEADGTLSARVYEQDPKRVFENSIRDEDWILDSQDAIDIFLENPEIHRCVMSNLVTDIGLSNNTRLSLERSRDIQDYTTYWVLWLPKSCNIEYTIISMNAKTGEIIGQRP